MAKINIIFNDKNYSIDESSFAAASARLQQHLSTVMNGSGAVINLGGTSYNIDSTKLSAATNAFVSHLGTIAGGAGGSDTLTWDGNTEGLVSVANMLYKVSDAVLTDEQIKTATFTVSSGDTGCVGDMWEGLVSSGLVTDDAVVLFEGLVAIIRKDNIEIAGLVFPQKGIYFLSIDGIYIASLTIPNYTGFGGTSGSKLTVNSVEYSIDPTKVSGAVAELESVLSGLHEPDVVIVLDEAILDEHVLG